MSRVIEVTVGDVKASFELVEDIAPKTTAVLWESLPIEGPLVHSKRAGDACYVPIENGPLVELPQRPELMVSSIYRGYLAVRPPLRPGGGVELFLSYGLAEYRQATGRGYLTAVAKLQGDGAAFFDTLRKTNREGATSVVIRQASA
jgi:hypothetical protein